MTGLAVDRSRWTRVALDDVVRNVNDVVRDAEAEGIERVLGLEHLDPGELAITRWATTAEPTTFTKRVRRGQTLFGKRRAYQRKTAFAEFDAVCSGDILVFEPTDPGRLLPELLPFIASSDSFYERALETSAGSLSPRTRWNDIARYEFDLPPIEEQRRVAALLWAIESEAHSASSLLTAAMGAEDRLLCGIAREPGPTRPLSDLASMQQGRPIPSHLYSTSGMRLLRAGDLKPRGTVTWTADSVFVPESYGSRLGDLQLAPGDLVINMTAQTLDDAFLGRVCRIESACLLNQRIGRLRSTGEVEMDYLFAVLRSAVFTDFVAQRAEGSKIKHMHWRHIEGFPVPAPNPEARARRLHQWSSIKQLVAAGERRLAAAKSLRLAAVSRIFEGGATAL